MSRKIRLEDYLISPKSGFLVEDPLLVLPAYFEPWQEMASNAADLIASHKMREKVNQMPLLDHTRLEGHKELQLAHLALSVIASGYVWQDGPTGAPKSIPKCLAVPWWGVSEKLDVKPGICYFDIILSNWKLLDPSRPPSLENFGPIFRLPGGEAFDKFMAVSINVEYGFAKALQPILSVIEGVEENDEVKVTTSLDQLTEAIHIMQKSIALYHENLPAHIFFNQIIPFFGGWNEASSLQGLIYEGISEEPVKIISASAAQTPTVKLLDALLGMTVAPERQKHIDELCAYLIPSHLKFMDDIRNRTVTVKDYVGRSSNEDLKTAYTNCVTALTNIRSYHIQIVTKYVITQSNKKAKEADKETAEKISAGNATLIGFLKGMRNDTKSQQKVKK